MANQAEDSKAPKDFEQGIVGSGLIEDDDDGFDITPSSSAKTVDTDGDTEYETEDVSPSEETPEPQAEVSTEVQSEATAPDTDYEYSPDILSWAGANGISLRELNALSDSGVLEKVVGAISSSNNDGAEEVSQEAAQEEEAFKPIEGLEEYDEGIQKAFHSLEAQNKALRDQIETMRKNGFDELREHVSKVKTEAYQEEFKTQLGKLNRGDLFGDASQIQVGSGSTEAANRAKLIEGMLIITEGCARRGVSIPNEEALMKQAYQMVFGNESASPNPSASELIQKAERKAGKVIAKPSGRPQTPPVRGKQNAIQWLSERMGKQAAYDDESDGF